MDDGSLQITLPEGVALSMHDMYIERIAMGSTADGQTLLGFPVDSAPVEAWTLGTDDTIVTTAHSIDVFGKVKETDPNTQATTEKFGILAKATTDEHGEALNLFGRYTDQIAYSNDGTLAFIAGSKSNIYVFDTQTRSVVHTLHVVNSTTNRLRQNRRSFDTHQH